MEDADQALKRLAGFCEADDVAAAKALLLPLRNARDHDRLAKLAEAVARHDGDDPTVRRLHAQALIELGQVTVAIDVLQALRARLSVGHTEAAEADGLLGRAWKQIFFDAADKTQGLARHALLQAIAVYRAPYEADRLKTWHGVNLLALLHRARTLGIVVPAAPAVAALARELIATLQAHGNVNDPWHLATLAEAHLGLGDLDVVQARLKDYVAQPGVPDFVVASTLRQFSQVWDLQHGDDQARALVDILRARLLSLPKAELKLSPAEMQSAQQAPAPAQGQLEAVLGNQGAKTYAWWRAGIDRARSVAAIKRKLGSRIGTGFLVDGGDFGQKAGELLVLTNFHVVNREGASPGIRPGEAEVVFEAADAAKAYAVKEIVWSSPVERHDAALLRLKTRVEGIAPMPLCADLPPLMRGKQRNPDARVYIIGHPGGRELQFSFQDNELIDHEGPPAGHPPNPEVLRVHYRAPTEGGSSGSPVFDPDTWEVIALHHLGGTEGIGKLNGGEGSYAANEGIAIVSILDAIERGG